MRRSVLEFAWSASANRRAEFAGTASPYRDKKFLLHADCCKTIAPPATNVRLTPPRSGECSFLRHHLQPSPTPDVRARFLPRNAARWPFAQNAEKKALLDGLFSPHKFQWSCRPRCAAGLLHPVVRRVA